jgi:hypothetical protein
MSDPAMVPLDETRLRMIELESSPLPAGASGGPTDWVRRYLQELPPGAALRMVEQLREVRGALVAAVGVLERAGYDRARYEQLSEEERGSADWVTMVRCWALVGPAPVYHLRVTHGQQTRERAFPTPEAALAAAIETLEMNDGYPEAITGTGGEMVMGCAEILRAWEERHDPG